MSEDSRRGAPGRSRASDRTPAGRGARAGGRSGQRPTRHRGDGRGPGQGGRQPEADGKPGKAGGGDGSRRPGIAGPLGTVDAGKLTRLLEPVLGALEIDLEAVKVSSAGRRRVLRVVVDADGGVSLDDIADVSREISAKLDAHDAMGDAPYTLEVSSPGIDRPLTEPRHWRRAAGRLVTVPLTSGQQDRLRDAHAGPPAVSGRVARADQDTVTLEVEGTRRTFGYPELGPGRVQVEFGRLAEADEAGDLDLDAPGAGHRELAWSGEAEVTDDYLEDAESAAVGRADEEEPRGH
jgi:ribosome maturation factor RimP